jgi:hypothetical protein
VQPDGFDLLEGFWLDPFQYSRYRGDSATIDKTVCLLAGMNRNNPFFARNSTAEYNTADATLWLLLQPMITLYERRTWSLAACYLPPHWISRFAQSLVEIVRDPKCEAVVHQRGCEHHRKESPLAPPGSWT